MTDPNVTARQQKWFASIRDGLERDTGRSLSAWIEIAQLCPQTGQRAQLKWLKENHGLLQNRAMLVLDEAFGAGPSWTDAQALIDALWVDAGSCAILLALEAAIAELPETVRTARKGYTAWSRRVQFAALRPLRDGGAMLGVAVAAAADGRLEACRGESWSERLRARMRLAGVDDVAQVMGLLRTAWDGA